MVQLSGHYDGKVFVPDEPVDLPVGRSVRIVVDVDGDEGVGAGAPPPPSRASLFGACRGMFRIAEDFEAPLDGFAEYRS